MSKKVYFDWTDDKKYKEYKKSELTLEVKLATILEKFKLKPGFEELEFKAIPLLTHFKRMQEDVVKKHGISMKGANLSKLDEEPSELVTLMVNMAKEVSKEKQHKVKEKQKKAEKNKKMNMFEKLKLADQGKINIKKESDRSPDGVVGDRLSTERLTKSSNFYMPFGMTTVCNLRR